MIHRSNNFFSFYRLFFVLLIIYGCSGKQESALDVNQKQVKKIEYNGFSMPVFNTSVEQLNYALSLFHNRKEKEAALMFLISRFPSAGKETGQAQLELAYMCLGEDFRLADRSDCIKSLSKYETILKQYADLPYVCAKAHWYMGWIYTELIKDKSKGIDIYKIVAQKYPDEIFLRSSPVPWLSLVFPKSNKKNYIAGDKITYSWADLALLEIIKNTDDKKAKFNAFNKLWNRRRKSLATGYALREMLRHFPSAANLVKKAYEYLQFNTVNPALKADIRYALNEFKKKK